MAIDVQPVAHPILGVVFALNQGFAGFIVEARRGRRVEGHVIDPPAARMDAPTAHALDDFGIGHGDFDHRVNGHAGRLQGFGLRDGAGKAIEQKSAAAIRLGNPFPDQGDDDVVGDQCAAVHHLLDLFSQRRAGLHGRPQHVARGDLRDREGVANELRLGALARPGRPQQYDFHGCSLVTC